MKTMKILNAILISSLLLGCDNKPQSDTKNEASEHNGRTNASTSVSADNTGKVSFEAKKSELGRVKKPRDYKHSPKASQDAQIVAFYRDNDSKDLTPAYQMFKVFYAVLLEHPSYYNIDNPEAAILRRFIKNAGFDENKINWCIASGEFDFSDPYQIIDPSSLAVVVNIKHSSEELRELILDLADETKQFLRNDLTIVPETTTGEKALQISLNNPRDINISPYIASLDDELIVITGSRRILRKQIALYRNGAQEKKEVSEILSDEDVMLGAVLVNSGKTVNNFISVHEQEMRRDSEVDIALEAIEQLNYKQFGTLTVGIKANDETGVNAFASLTTASESDVLNVCAIIKSLRILGIAAARHELRRNERWEKKDEEETMALMMAQSLLNDSEVNSEGKKVTATLPIPGLVIKDGANLILKEARIIEARIIK